MDNVGTYSDTLFSITESCSSVDMLSLFLGFVIGIVFTLCAICCGVTTAWGVNYNVTRKLREEYVPPYEASYVRQHHFPEELDQISPGVINSDYTLSNVDDMSTDSFQLKWESIQDTREEEFAVSSIEDFQSLLQSALIYCLASGEVGDQMKYYLHAKDTSEQRTFLMEVVIDQKTKASELALKTTNCSERDIADFINYFFNAISSIIVHPV